MEDISAGKQLINEDDVTAKEINSGAIVIADEVFVQDVNSGAIVVANEIVGLHKVTSGAVIIANKKPSNVTFNSGGKEVQSVRTYINELQTELNELDEDDTFYETEKEELENRINALKQANI